MEDQKFRTPCDSIKVGRDSWSKEIYEIRSLLQELVGNPRRSKPTPVEFPRFCGENPELWISQAERFFDFYEIAENHKLSLASSYLDGTALSWYQWLFQNKQLDDWNYFTAKVLIRFPKRHLESLQGRLANQVPSVNEYSSRFEDVLWGFSEPDVLSSCPAHVYPQWRSKTNPSLPQKFDVQSECKSKTDAHTMFDEMSNRCCPKTFTVASSDVPIELAVTEEDNVNLDNKHIMDIGDSTQEISAPTLSSLTPTESTFEDGKSKEGSEAKEQVEGLKDVVQQKLSATTNIHEEWFPGEFFPIFRSLFTVFETSAHLRDIRAQNKTTLLGTIPFYSYVDNWFDTGQDFEVDSGVLLSVESEELNQVSHEESWLIPFHGCGYKTLHNENFTMANEVSLDTKNSVPDEIFLSTFENPSWAGEFALIIKQPLLHDFQLVILSCMVRNLELLERKIVEVVRYSPDIICLRVHRGSLEHLSKSSFDEDGDHLYARHARNSYSQWGLGLGRRLEEMCIMSAYCYAQLISRGIFALFSTLGQSTLISTWCQFCQNQFESSFPFDPGSIFLSVYRGATRSLVFCTALGNLKHDNCMLFLFGVKTNMAYFIKHRDTILVKRGAEFMKTHTVVQFLNVGFKVTILDNFHNSVEENVASVRELVGPQLPQNLEGHLNDDQEMIFLSGLELFFEFLESPDLMCQRDDIVTLCELTVTLGVAMVVLGMPVVTFLSLGMEYGVFFSVFWELTLVLHLRYMFCMLIAGKAEGCTFPLCLLICRCAWIDLLYSFKSTSTQLPYTSHDLRWNIAGYTLRNTNAVSFWDDIVYAVEALFVNHGNHITKLTFALRWFRKKEAWANIYRLLYLSMLKKCLGTPGDQVSTLLLNKPIIPVDAYVYSNLEDKVLIGAGGIVMIGPRPVLARQPNITLSDYVWDTG